MLLKNREILNVLLLCLRPSHKIGMRPVCACSRPNSTPPVRPNLACHAAARIPGCNLGLGRECSLLPGPKGPRSVAKHYRLLDRI